MKQVTKQEMIEALDKACPNGAQIMGGAFFGEGVCNNSVTLNGAKFATRTVNDEKQYFVKEG